MIVLTFGESEVDLPSNTEVSLIQMCLKASGRGTGEWLLLTPVHLLIEFPLWCNCITRYSGYRRGVGVGGMAQVTTVNRVPLSLQPEGHLSTAL